MPGFDDRLTRELERAARPAAPDVVRTFEDVTRRRAHRAVIRKVQVVAVVIAILAGTAGAFALLDDRLDVRQPATTETIAPPYHQMSSWRLQWRPVVASGTTGLNLTCVPEECTEGDLDPTANVALEGRDGQVHQLGPAFADASDVSMARVVQLPEREWVVTIQLELQATATLATATEEAVTAPPPMNRIAAVLDGEVVMAPTVEEPIRDGSLQVTGLGEEGSALLAAELTRGMPPATPSETPSSEGQDIGLGANWCEVQRLDGLDLLGDGTHGTAWTGYHVDDGGDCSRNPKWYVAVDVTGDARADVAWGAIEQCRYTGCAPLGATDLDGDGDRELVIHTFFSIVDHLYFSIREGSEVPYVLEPILVAEPGNLEAAIEPGEPLMTSAAGDAGYASWMRCEGYPEDPVLVWAWTNHPVESPEPAEWHETKLRLEADGMFHVVASDDFALDADQDPGLIRSTAPACGIDFNIWEKPNPG